MKINACDLCLVEGKLTIAKWRVRHKHNGIGVTIHCCVDHRTATRGKTFDEMNNLVSTSYHAVLRMENSLRPEGHLTKVDFKG